MNAKKAYFGKLAVNKVSKSFHVNLVNVIFLPLIKFII